MDYLRGSGVRIPGVVGPAVEAQTFSDCWVEGRVDVSAKLGKRMRVFEARTVANLSLSPGRYVSRILVTTHLWRGGIVGLSEAIGEPVSLESAKSRAEKLIKNQELYIWDNGGPVSIAGVSRPIEKWHNNRSRVHAT